MGSIYSSNKFEARSTKSETIYNHQNSNDQNPVMRRCFSSLQSGRFVSVIGTFELWICFGFRYSDFGFGNIRVQPWESKSSNYALSKYTVSPAPCLLDQASFQGIEDLCLIAISPHKGKGRGAWTVQRRETVTAS